MSPRVRTVLLPVTAATFMTAFDGAAVQLVLPVVGEELAASPDAAHWVMTAFLLVSTSALLPAGRAGDILGRTRIWRFGVALFVAASVLCALMPNILALSAARALQGFGSALVTANSTAILVEAFPHHRGRVVGIGNVALAIAIVLGPPLGALLTEAVSWRLIFLVIVPVGIAVWYGTRRLPPSHRRQAPLDWPSGLLSIVGLGCVLLGGTFGERWGWGSARTLWFFGIGSFFLLAFGFVQARSEFPLIERRLVANRLVVSGFASAVCAYAALFAATISMPFFFLHVQNRPLDHAGLIVGFVPIALAISAPLAGSFADRIGSRWLCTPALALVSLGLVVLIGGGRELGDARLILGLVFLGVGLGTFEAPNDVAVLASLPDERLSAGTAVLNAMRNLGMTLGAAVGGTLLQIGLDHGEGSVEDRIVYGVHLALWAGAGLALLGALLAAIRPGRGRG